jgi:hypothetical protein
MVGVQAVPSPSAQEKMMFFAMSSSPRSQARTKHFFAFVGELSKPRVFWTAIWPKSPSKYVGEMVCDVR